MRLKKAVVSAVILYAVLFLIASALIFNIKNEIIFGYIMVVLSAVLAFMVSKHYYFKGMKVDYPLKNGIELGIVLVIVVFLIEIPVMVYGFASQQGWSYFTSWHLIIGYLLMLAVPVVTAYMMKKK
ncbi:MAG: hypothetical protein QMD85_01695 [Candidatus Aenigmarchaeota archaeon]|nr:hypothetical protein [Candidatus Aenigmarchaeota archaeon]MDI6722266.1 hypothetical protein [Candidatus Aenigmarchaeota archaeon]